MLEEYMIRHCSPTLAGLKTANMFSCRYERIDTLRRELQEENRKLNGKGVYAEILRLKESKALIYVYRRSMLEADLGRREVQELLAAYGYQSFGANDCLNRLRLRLRWYGDFPHEVGLFLGYPFQDVQGFIEQKGENYKCRGIWKVYGDVTETQKIFAKLKKCAEVYGRLFAGGRSIIQLTVAA